MFDWLKDRKFTVIGACILILSGILLCIQLLYGLGMPTVFGNVLINTVFVLGLTIVRHGQKVDPYKNFSEE